MKRKTGRMCWGVLLAAAMAVSCIGMPAKVKAANGDLVFDAQTYAYDDGVVRGEAIKDETTIKYVKPIDQAPDTEHGEYPASRQHQNLISIPVTKSGTYEVKVTYFTAESPNPWINVKKDENSDDWNEMDVTESGEVTFNTFKTVSIKEYDLVKGNNLVIQNGDGYVWISEVILTPINLTSENGYSYKAIDYMADGTEKQDDVYVKHNTLDSALKTPLVSIPLGGIESGYYNISITYKSGQGGTTMPYYQINEGRYNWKQVPANQFSDEWLLRNEIFGDPSGVYLTAADTLNLGQGGQWYWLRSVTLTRVEDVLEPKTTFDLQAVGTQRKDNGDGTNDIRFVFSLPKDCDYTVTDIGVVASAKSKNPSPRVDGEVDIALCSGESKRVQNSATKFYSKVNSGTSTYERTNGYIITLRLSDIAADKQNVDYCCRAYATVVMDGKEYVVYSDTLVDSVNSIMEKESSVTAE